MDESLLLTRRVFLRGAAALVAGAGVAREAVGAVAAPGMHRYESYGWLRGFSVVPSWGARIEEAWWSYDGGRMREEVALARTVQANCIRLWIEFTAWMAAPEKVTAHFLDAVAAIDEAGMKVMPCLFNRWHDSKFDYGGTYVENLLKGWKPHLEYVRALVTPLVNDERVLIWDLCNEPQAAAPWAKEMSAEIIAKEQAWLAEVAKTVRECGAQQPITMGTMTGGNIEAFADLCDVLCGHPYAQNRDGIEKQIASFRELQQKHGKPFLVNECFGGALDDAARAGLVREQAPLLAAAGFGWMGWALREGKAISTRRDRYDANGLKGEGFHPFFTREGALRGGLEFLREKPGVRAPWEKRE